MGAQQSSEGQTTPRRSGRPLLSATDVGKLPLISHHVYALLAEHVYNEPDRRALPPGWKVMVTAADVQLDKEGYFAAAYVNDELRHCIIAERGTHDALGIRAGVWMYFDEPTIQFSLAEEFSKSVRLRLSLTKDTEAYKYNLSYSGHSLGAVIAACRACAEHTYAITFESPGCGAFVEKTMHPFKSSDVDIITYLRAPNPINTLRPQAGYVIQLPYMPPKAPAAPAKEEPEKKQGVVKSAVSRLEAVKTALPNPQDYIKTKLIERSVPEIKEYITKLEPLLRDMLTNTEQIHSISSIVGNFEQGGPEPPGEVVLTWPSHLMQYLEYFNTMKSMEDPANQDPLVFNAYSSLLQRIYLTSKRPKYRIPIKVINKDSQKLVRAWWMASKDQMERFPLTDVEKRALNCAKIVGENLECQVLTGLQMKQLLSLLVMKPKVQFCLDNLSVEFEGQPRSHL